MLSLRELEISSLLKDFKWLKKYDYVNFETLNEGYEFVLEAVLDIDDNMFDIKVRSGNYITYLREDSDFWVFNELRNGNWVGLLEY